MFHLYEPTFDVAWTVFDENEAMIFDTAMIVGRIVAGEGVGGVEKQLDN
jgi:hypothetical protein